MKIDTLSLKELTELQAKIPEVIAAKKAAEADKVKAAIAETVAKAGFTMADIFGNGKRGQSVKVLPKYRNPKDPTQTWSGRGRAPLWMPKRKTDYDNVAI